MALFDDLLDADPAGRAKRSAADAAQQALRLAGAGLYGIGWLLAKAVLLVLLGVGGFCYGIGWAARQAVPAVRWMGAAVRLGWDDACPGKGAGRGA